jgi:hypothetical protein
MHLKLLSPAQLFHIDHANEELIRIEETGTNQVAGYFGLSNRPKSGLTACVTGWGRKLTGNWQGKSIPAGYPCRDTMLSKASAQAAFYGFISSGERSIRACSPHLGKPGRSECEVLLPSRSWKTPTPPGRALDWRQIANALNDERSKSNHPDPRPGRLRKKPCFQTNRT